MYRGNLCTEFARRIRQLGEKQKIKEKSRERENPNESNKDGKDVKPTKIPSKVSESRVPPSQVQSLNSFRV